jgi:hypothetical protein
MKTGQEIRLLKELKKINGKVKFNHSGHYDGQRQTLAIIRVDGIYYMGIARCGKKDTFNKNIGRTIALGRALAALKKGDQVIFSQDNIGILFKEDRDKPNG